MPSKDEIPSKGELQAYKGAEVAKIFPLYGTAPFKGTVNKVDLTGKDSKPFRVVYEDGDSEWITLQEVKSIMVKDGSKQEAPKSDKKRKDDASAAAAADQQEHKKQKKHKHSKSSSQQQAAPAPAAAAAAAGTDDAKAAKAAAKKAPAAGAAAASGKGTAAGVTSFTVTAGAARAAADKSAAGTSKDAAAAAASGKGAVSGMPSKAAAAAAAPPAAAAPAAAGTPGRKGAGGASMSTADTQGIVAAIHQAAAPTADKLVHDRQVARMPRQGPGAAVLPAMSQAVVAGGHCYISLQSAPKPPRHSTTPGKSLSQQQQLSASGGYAAAIDYKAECEALLGELQRLLSHAGTDKRWLIKVRVTLRSMCDGLPGFQEAWNAWAQRDELPVMSLVEGAGPFSSAGVMLEATALVNA